jgi:hypothetical protein
MSLTGISKVSTSFSTFVNVLRDTSNTSSSTSTTVNVELKKTQPYSLNVAGSNKTGQSYMRVSKSMAPPASGKVNLGFTSLLVKDTEPPLVGLTLRTSFVSVLVSNALAYSYSKEQPQTRQSTQAYTNVQSTNSEYEIVLGLDGIIAPTVNVFYPNVGQQVAIELDEFDAWS